MTSIVARTSTLFVAFVLLLAACGGEVPAASTGSTAATSAPVATSAPAVSAPTVAASQPTAASSGSAAPAAGDPISIGIAVAQTSNVSLFGQEQTAGAQIAQDLLNQRGGVNGRPITLVVQDTSGDEAGAINAFNTLITNDKVVGIVGPTLSQQAFAADPIANKAGVPIIGPSNTAGGIPQIGDYVARVSAPVSVVAPTAVKAALKINPSIKKVAVLFAQNDAFSKSETVVFQRVVTDTFKLDLLPVQTFQTTDTDFTAQAGNVLASQPDLVIISGLAADSGNLVKQLRDLGYKGLIVGGNGLNSPNMFPVCKAACDGVLVAQAYSPQNSAAINKAFYDAYKAKQNKEPSQFSAQAFAAVQVFTEALSALDKATPIKDMNSAALRTALNKQILAGTYDTPLGNISFTPEGDIKQDQFYVAQIKMNPDGESGQFALVP